MGSSDLKKRLVIGISGHIGAGKTTAGRYLASRHGFDYIRYSQILADWFDVDPEDKSRLQVVGREVMFGGLQPELNRRLIEKMSAAGDWCVDGLRHPSDYETLRSTVTPNFCLIYIDCPQQERWRRLQKRPRFETFEKFCDVDADPVEQYIQILKEHADICIENVGPIQGLGEKLSEFTIAKRKESL